jgi:adenylate kinase
MVVVLIGPPGCGKGTQSRLLTQLLDVPAFSTGEVLRVEASSGTALGNEVRQSLDAGALVNDELVNRVVANCLAREDFRQGAVLDGYPRTAAQADYLDRLLGKLSRPAAVALHFEIDRSTVLSRLAARRYCPICGRVYNLVTQPPADFDFCDDDGMVLVARKDDHPSVIGERLRTFDAQTAPVLRHYRGRLHRIDAVRRADDVLAEIASRLERHRARIAC